MIPLEGELQPGRTVREVAEVGRATVWCQVVIVVKTASTDIETLSRPNGSKTKTETNLSVNTKARAGKVQDRLRQKGGGGKSL